MNNIIIEVNKLENSCFVVMPFNTLYQIEYENIIKPTLEELNIICVRGDEIYSKQRIMDDIWESIKSCRFVIAELTGKNPNVLYEIGLAHALGKPVIILTRNSDDVPFDLKDLRYLFYDINDPFWGDNLKKGLKNLIIKVLESSEIDKYLAGITPIPSSLFPKIKKQITGKKEDVKINNISGTWKGTWEAHGSVHNILLNINQNQKNLSCVGTINYFDNNLITVVQQIFEGTINYNKIDIKGVNYTYIERGNSEDYGLDNFNLILENDKLIGSTYDSHGDDVKIDLVLNRV